MALTLLRHAPVPDLFKHRYNGWTDIPIDHTAFDAYTNTLLHRRSFDLIYSSDLQRCTQTLDAIGFTCYRTDTRLREVRFKAHIEGKRFEDIAARADFSDALLEDRQTWHRYVCMESYEMFQRRIRSFLSELPNDQEVLICSHAGTITMMLSMLGCPKGHIDYLECVRIEGGL